MANFIYTYTDVLNAVNSKTHGKSGILTTDANGRAQAISAGVRQIYGLVDFRSSKRRTAVSPGVYTQVYSYPAPSDLKGMGICDIVRQVDRREDWFLTDIQEFDYRKWFNKSMIAMDDHDALRFLRLATALGTTETIFNNADSITGWVASGNATDLAIDTVNFVNPNGSLGFDTNGAAPVLTLNTTTQDLTAYNNQQWFAWVYIPSVGSAPTFTLKWGSDSSNYWSASATTTHEGLAFYVGWNLVRFSWPSSATGTPDITKVGYLQFSGASCSTANGWRVNEFVVRIPNLHDIVYYTKYAWQDSSSKAYKENPTNTGDFLVADTEEFDIIASYCAALAAQELRNEDWKILKEEVNEMIENYKVYKYASERLLYQTTYERLATLEGDYDVYNDQFVNPNN